MNSKKELSVRELRQRVSLEPHGKLARFDVAILDNEKRINNISRHLFLKEKIDETMISLFGYKLVYVDFKVLCCFFVKHWTKIFFCFLLVCFWVHADSIKYIVQPTRCLAIKEKLIARNGNVDILYGRVFLFFVPRGERILFVFNVLTFARARRCWQRILINDMPRRRVVGKRNQAGWYVGNVCVGIHNVFC